MKKFFANIVKAIYKAFARKPERQIVNNMPYDGITEAATIERLK